MNDLKLTCCLWLPSYLVAVLTAAQQGIRDLWLFAIAMALAVWSACDAAVLLIRKASR